MSDNDITFFLEFLFKYEIRDPQSYTHRQTTTAVQASQHYNYFNDTNTLVSHIWKAAAVKC